MEPKIGSVNVQSDHLNKVGRAKPLEALSELIWNSLDADATKVDVFFTRNEVDGLKEVVVKDNGVGIPFENIDELFGNLGGSWKKSKPKTEKGRSIHGAEGQGRFKSLSIGEVVKWDVRYKKNGSVFQYEIEINSKSIKKFVCTVPENEHGKDTGVSVTIFNPRKNFKSFEQEKAIVGLLPVFALYLSNYAGVDVLIEKQPLVPAKLFENKKTLYLGSFDYSDNSYEVMMDVIEWKELQIRDLFFCDENGFPIEKYGKQIRGVGDYFYTAYVRSELIKILNDDNRLALEEFEPVVKKICDVAIPRLKEHFLNRTAEDAQTEIDKWKQDDIYPFKEKPMNPVEDAERKVFDIVAVNIKNNLPDFEQTDRKNKAFQLRMLRHAIEKNPDDLRTIILEVLQLPTSKQNQLAELLRQTSLTSIISAARIVSDRLKFIIGLEQLLFSDEYKKKFKERSQLHRILANNTWIFGDSFSLSVDDQSLTQVLGKHVKKVNKDIVIDEPVLCHDGKIGIVDLMLSQSISTNKQDLIEHLVVELKAPKVNVGEKEIGQIKKYAIAVANDERFRSLKAVWHFWLITNDYDEFASWEFDDKELPSSGIIQKKSKNGITITVYLKTWSQIISENKHRLQFIQNKLNYNVDKTDATRYLRERYAEFTKGLPIEDEKQTL